MGFFKNIVLVTTPILPLKKKILKIKKNHYAQVKMSALCR